MGKVTIMSAAFGLNTKDHPHKLSSSKGTYLSSAVNVDITDTNSVERRCGYTQAVTDLTNAHSLCSFANRYALFADGSTLYAFDTESDLTVEVRTGLSVDAVISYTRIADMLLYSNGSERGLLKYDSDSIIHADYPSLELLDTDSNFEIREMPLTNITAYYKGSVIGANIGESFLVVSEPYRLNAWNSVNGSIYVPAKINWIKAMENAFIVGTDAGIYAYTGSGLHDFQEKPVRFAGSKSICCSDYERFVFSTSNGGAEERYGRIVVNEDNVVFIDDSLSVMSLTDNLSISFNEVKGGSILCHNNSYIFSGVI